MEKEMEKGTLVLENGDEFGTVKIANDVVAMIASLAATEVDGVSAMTRQFQLIWLLHWSMDIISRLPAIRFRKR